jgi:uncharacterized protein (TIGR01777 family)
MKVLVFGGTGFIGKYLIPLLIEDGYEVILFSRNPSSYIKTYQHRVTAIKWDTTSTEDIIRHLHGNYSIINLAGAGIGSRLWTQSYKNKILSSRLSVTKAITDAILLSPVKPIVFLQGSAIGYYGTQADLKLDENAPKGKGFLSDVVDAWEKSVMPVEKIQSRIVYLRNGIVLGNDGGILPLMLIPFKLYIGGHPGNGRQWISWIHIEDVTRVVIFLLKNENATGVFNLTSPAPVMMKNFTRLAGKVIKRPSWLHVPAFVFRLILREMADDLLLTSQKVYPVKLLDSGFRFKYPDLESAFKNLFDKSKDHE